MFDLSLHPTPLQMECERLRQEVEIGKQMLGRMMAEYGALRDENERLREALDTVARVSNDPAIVTCAKHALRPNAKAQGRAACGESPGAMGCAPEQTTEKGQEP